MPCFLNAAAIENAGWIGRGIFDYQFYFASKNTPELGGDALAAGHGLGVGIELFRKLGKQFTLYASMFDRVIFESPKRSVGDVATGNGASFRIATVSYPVISSTNTIVGRLGISIFLSQVRRNLDVYFKVLHGNITGFTDSRERRLTVAGGIQVCPRSPGQ